MTPSSFFITILLSIIVQEARGVQKKTDFNLIVCIDKDNGIGKNNGMPWKLKEDMQRFKKLTTGHNVIMGRKTLDSIGKPLPNRNNIVLSRTYTETYDSNGTRGLEPVIMTPVNLDLFLKQNQFENKINWVIGGSEIYKLLMPLCTKLYVTQIDKSFECDTFFPTIDPKTWRLVSTSETFYSEKQGLNYRYIEYLHKW